MPHQGASGIYGGRANHYRREGYDQAPRVDPDWHIMSGRTPLPPASMHGPVIEGLYCEALMLMDDARAYFDGVSSNQSAVADAPTRIALSCEALKTTTRLMTIVAWLMALRSADAGAGPEPVTPLLGPATAADADACRHFPDTARLLIAASEELYRRAERLQAMLSGAIERQDSPVHSMVARLEDAINVTEDVKKRIATNPMRGKE